MEKRLSGWKRELLRAHGWIADLFVRSEPRALSLAYLQGLLSGWERKNGWQLAARGVRPRLPRRHLRHVRVHGERHGAWPAPGHYSVPAPYAALQGRRRTLSGTLARQSFSRGEGSRGGPHRLRPDHRRRWVYLGGHRQR